MTFVLFLSEKIMFVYVITKIVDIEYNCHLANVRAMESDSTNLSLFVIAWVCSSEHFD